MNTEKKEVDLKALKVRLIKKTIKNPYWGTAGAYKGSVNISDKT